MAGRSVRLWALAGGAIALAAAAAVALAVVAAAGRGRAALREAARAGETFLNRAGAGDVAGSYALMTEDGKRRLPRADHAFRVEEARWALGDYRARTDDLELSGMVVWKRDGWRCLAGYSLAGPKGTGAASVELRREAGAWRVQSWSWALAAAGTGDAGR